TLSELLPEFFGFRPSYYDRPCTVLEKQSLVLGDVGPEDQHVPKKSVRSPLICNESDDLRGTWFPRLAAPRSGPSSLKVCISVAPPFHGLAAGAYSLEGPRSWL